MLGGRIEQVGDDARQPEFVLAQVSEDVEPVRQMAVTPALCDAGRRQTRCQVRQKTLVLCLPGVAGVVDAPQKFGDFPGRGGDHRWLHIWTTDGCAPVACPVTVFHAVGIGPVLTTFPSPPPEADKRRIAMKHVWRNRYGWKFLAGSAFGLALGALILLSVLSISG